MNGPVNLEARAMERMVRAAPLSTWALFGAGIAMSGMVMGMVLVLWMGGWSAATESMRINYIGILAVMVSLDLMAVIAALAKARVAAHLPGGVNFDVGSSGPDGSQPAVTVTTEVNPK